MAIVLDRLTKRFAEHRAVDAVSVEIETGIFFAVLGPSGCGKSTLLRLIAGLEQADEGRIALHGREVAGPGLHVSPEERQTGVVFQSYALWPHMSVAENVAFPMETAGAGRKEALRETRGFLETVELDALAARKPADLSGGQRQRVALARCLAQGARTVLMDEPLANLDPHLRAAMEEETARFHERSGAATLYITHDQREAMALADRLAVMQDGRFIQTGAPDDVYRCPANETVARFIGRGAIVGATVSGAANGAAEAAIGDGLLTVRASEGQPSGPCRLLIRPGDVSVGEGALSLEGAVTHSVYRGGLWEAAVACAGLDEPLQIVLDRRAAAGERLPISLNGGWVLPA